MWSIISHEFRNNDCIISMWKQGKARVREGLNPILAEIHLKKNLGQAYLDQAEPYLANPLKPSACSGSRLSRAPSRLSDLGLGG